MKVCLLILMLAIIGGCGTQKVKNVPIEKEIAEYEAKSISDVKSHAQHLLEQHPELTQESKAKIYVVLNKTMDRMIELKEEESKVVQSLLNRTLENKNQKNYSKALKERLKNIYNLKFENVRLLIEQINSMDDAKEIDQTFTRDAYILMRDFR